MLRAAVLGRDQEMATVRQALERSRSGDGGLLLISGEPGIGKTTIVGAAAEEARRSSMLVVSGTCWDGGGAPGYWPWIQVVRAVQRVAAEQWPSLLAAAGDGLAWLVDTDASHRPVHGSDESAFQIADAVCRVVTAVAETRPMLILLEDLHWADAASIKLLDFLVRQITLERVVVIGTYRDTEVQAELQAVRSLLIDLESKSTSIALAGLDRVSVAALVGRTSGRQPDGTLVEKVFRRTAGNPFFVEQMARLFGTLGSLEAIPPSVKQALRQRLARVPYETRELLLCAAVLGPDCQLELLAAAAQRPSDEVSRLLEPAVAAGLVAGPVVSSVRFVHDLVRETLNAQIDEQRTHQLCAAVVEAVRAKPQLARSLLLAQIAQWAYLAVPDIAVETAVEYVLAAAAEATRRHASEEVCAHYRRALELLPEDDGDRRLNLTLLLGTEEQRSGQLDGARRTFSDLISAARAIDNAELFARAVLGLQSVGHSVDDQPMVIRLLDEGRRKLEANGGLGGALAARLLAAASQARTHNIGESRTYIEELSERAVDLARASGDDDALGFCLLARHDAIWRAGTAYERIALANEMTSAARRSDDPALELQASLLRTVGWLEQGDPRGLTETRGFAEAAERHHFPRFRYVAMSRQATVATLQGRFDEARALMDEALAYGQQLGEAEAIGVWADQRWELARVRGLQSDLEEAATALRASGGADDFMLEAAFSLQNGDATRLRTTLEQIQSLADTWPRWAELAFNAMRAELAAACGDPSSRSAVREALRPVADQWAVLGGAVLVHGPMAYWLAMVDAADGCWDAAIDEFASARRAADRLLARPWSVRAALGLAETLLVRAGPGDIAEATRLLDEVAADADALGMQDVVERVASARQQFDGRGNVFRRDEEVWTLSFAGRTVIVPDAKGLRDIHTLLLHAAYDVSAMTLARPDGLHVAQAEPVLDAQAKLEYARRIQLIEAEIDDALSVDDDDRAAGLDRERALLIDQLRRATGLGGRARHFSDDAERARKAVRARIRDALRHLDARHPELASHLRECISTGSTCRYQPKQNTVWLLE